MKRLIRVCEFARPLYPEFKNLQPMAKYRKGFHPECQPGRVAGCQPGEGAGCQGHSGRCQHSHWFQVNQSQHDKWSTRGQTVTAFTCDCKTNICIHNCTYWSIELLRAIYPIDFLALGLTHTELNFSRCPSQVTQ